MADELLPTNLAAERVVLGCLIEDQTLWGEVKATCLTAADFSLADHRRIFAAIETMLARHVPVDYVSCAEFLGNAQPDYVLLASLIEGIAICPSHVRYHAGLVKSKARLRELAKLGQWLFESAVATGANPDSIRGETLHRLDRLSGMTDSALSEVVL